MKSRAPLLALAAIALVAGVVALGTSMWRGGNPVEERALARLRARRAALHDSLDARIARDPMLSYAQRHSSSVSLALAESVLTTVIEEVIVRYLDRIELDLEPDLDKHQGGDLNVDTPIGRLKAGEWDVVVGIRQIDGVLAARRATVAVTGTNRVHVVIPTEVREGHGAVTLDFKWDSKAAFNLLCRDFKASSAVRGTILPQRHVVRGDLVLSASEDGIVVDPEFPREKFPLSMTLTPESWKEIRKVLEEQDVPTRCGVLMKPDR